MLALVAGLFAMDEAARGTPAEQPAVVAAWLDPATHTALSGFTPGGDAVLVRSAIDFSSAVLGRARCDGEGCGGFEPVVLPGLAQLSGAAVLPDGSLLVTSSQPTGDPLAPDGWNLFAVAADGDTKAAATPLRFPVASPFAECCAAPAADGGFFFASDRAGTWDVYRATPDGRGGHTVHRVAALSSEPGFPGEPGYFGEWPSFVDPAGRFLLLSSIRPGGLGADDVYVACATPDGGWSPPRNLGAPVNTAGFEDSARVGPDGRTLYWSSRPAREGTSRVLRWSHGGVELCPPTAAAAGPEARQ